MVTKKAPAISLNILILCVIFSLMTGCGGGGSGNGPAPDPSSPASNDSKPPKAPTSVSASDGSYSDKVKITWKKPSGATFYDVFKNTSSSSSGATKIASKLSSTSYTDTSVQSSKTYYYWVKAGNDTGLSGFSSYNTGYAATPYPNLYVTSVSAPYILWTKYNNSQVPYTKFSVATVLRNSGNKSASNFRVGLYLSKDTKLSSSDYNFGYHNVSHLSAGSSMVMHSQGYITKNLSYGSYYVLAVADDYNNIKESKESDNGTYFGKILVNCIYHNSYCDLATSNFSTNSISVYGGSSLYTIASVLNNASKSIASNYAIYNKFYLSTNSTISTSDTYLDYSYIYSIGAMKTWITSDYVKIPDRSPGIYYLGCYADATNVVSEYSGSNNTHSWPIIIK